MGCVTIDPIGTNLDTTVLVGATQLLTCLEEQLAKTVAGPVCRACVYPGISVPMDYCSFDSPCASGAHGMAAVRVASIAPLLESSLNSCQLQDFQIAVTYEMTALRCAHVVQRVNGSVVLPSCDELLSDSAIVLDDAAAMRRTIKCCFGKSPQGGGCAPRFEGIGSWQPKGPLSGCVGGTMSLSVVLGDCGCTHG